MVAQGLVPVTITPIKGYTTIFVNLSKFKNFHHRDVPEKVILSRFFQV